MSTENYRQIERLALEDVSVLVKKGEHYGRSWMKRGGVGAFMMLARKWDRIENDCYKNNWDILEALKMAGIDGKDLLDDISDLRRYLLLVESEYRDSISKDAPSVQDWRPIPTATLTGSLESRGEAWGGTEHK